jgi:hypothetical protein
MKKSVYSILLLSLVIGLPLMIIDFIGQNKDDFHVPTGFSQLVIDLSDQDRSEEPVLEIDLTVPSNVELFMQSDAPGIKIVRVVSESVILGYKHQEIDFAIGQYTGSASTSSTLVMAPGKLSLALTGEKTDGKIVIGYRITDKDPTEYERLMRIHNGDLENPPSGYEKVYSSDLSGQSYKDEVVYTLSLNRMTNVGFSIYTSAKNGNVSVDIVGVSSNYYGVIHSEYHRICDQLETTLPPGEYQFKLTSDNADGELVVYIKQ